MKLASLDSVQNAHDDSIWTAAWVRSTEESPALLLTGGLDETARLWDPSNFTCVQTFTGHCLGVVSVATHPTRRIAASASLDSFIRVFEVDTNKTIATLEAPPSEVWQLQFSPNGNNLAAAGGDSSVKLWDTTQWQLVVTLSIPRQGASQPSDKGSNKKFVLSVAWSPDGRLH
ncbi:WD repeat-containing protein vip3 [Datura stramonium]|uniref:WD repeat-containing protein vip3 n=1 Tax=Datura stramonium TaxID=4076 RepID=A0ABS8S939_DATST|nr:WD repeat-containing protein vip3 [Datura stramonium]